MAKEMQLVDSYMYNGKVYGPGPVTAPDDAFTKAVTPREKATMERLRSEGQTAVALLPSGHPYHVLLGAMAQQPPQFEGDASSVAFPSVITGAETEMLNGQVGEGDSGAEAPKPTTETPLTVVGTAGSAPGTPTTAPTVVIRPPTGSGGSGGGGGSSGAGT